MLHWLSTSSAHILFKKRDRNRTEDDDSMDGDSAYSTVSSSRLAAASSALSVCLHIEGLKHVIEG